MRLNTCHLICLFAFLLCLLPSSGQAQETYTWGHPQPQGNAIHNIVFADVDHGWAVAGDATVLATDDGGESWQLIYGPYPSAGEMNDLTIVSDGVLVAVGEGVFRSTDGGFNWTPVANPATGELLDLTAIPGGGLSACGENGTVIISSDGGLTWADVGPGMGTARHHLWRSASEGYVVGIQLTHRTLDGGQTWTQMSGFAQFQFNEIYFRDNLHAVIVEDFATWHSDDGGATWTEFFAPVPPLYRYRTVVLSPDHLVTVAFGEGSELWESFDGGQNWNALQYRNTVGFSCVVQTPGDRLIWGSDVGDLFWSDDTGATIHNATTKLDEAAPSAPFNRFMVRPDGVLFAANQPSFSIESQAWLRSDDGGLNWTTPTNSPGLRWINASVFLDNEHGLAAYRNQISITDDGGETWTTIELDEDRTIWQAALLASDRYFLITSLNSGGDLLRSTDGGLTWSPVGGGLPVGNLQGSSLFFQDENTGFVSGLVNSVPRMYRTVDGGATWQQRAAMGLDAGIRDFHFVSPDTGLVAIYQGDTPGIYRTTDGGTSFTHLYLQRLTDLEFNGVQNGIAFGPYATTALRTDDGGLTWAESLAPFSGPGGGIHTGYLYAAAPTATGWVFGGDSGRILVAVNPSAATPVPWEASVPRAGNCRLISTVPNPFNPMTTITFEIDRAGPVKVAVFDLAGRHVRTLVDGEREAGGHQTTWDGNSQTGLQVASGVYFVRVTTTAGIDFRTVSLVK